MPVPETKYFNKAISHISTATSTNVLTAIPAGTSVQERIGRKIKVKALSMNLRRIVDQGEIRCVLYVPKQANQNLALASMHDPIDNDQFWVLRDWYFSDGLQNNPGIWTHTFPMGLNVEYDGTGSASQIRNTVKLFMFSGGTADVVGHTKVWYTDV